MKEGKMERRKMRGKKNREKKANKDAPFECLA
jgi:hypothetical protein